MTRAGLVLVLLLIGCTAGSSAGRARPGTDARSLLPHRASPDEAWRSKVPVAGEAAALSYPQPEVGRLPNGLTLYVVRRPAGVVSLQVIARHGPSPELVGKSGLVALTTRMLSEGTHLRSAEELARAAENLGSELLTWCERDTASVALTVLNSDLEAGLEILAEVVTEPAFPAERFERVRLEWLDRLRAERQDPERLASLAGLRLLLGELMGAPVGGSLSDVEKLRRQDLFTVHRRVFCPENAALVVVGDVGLGEVEPLAHRLLGRWQRSRTPAPRAVDPPRPGPGPRLVVVERPGAVQSSLFLAKLWPRRQAPGYEVRAVLATLLGGMYSSRLNKNLREEHAYCYAVGARAVATRLWGALVIAAEVETEHTTDALEQIFFELETAHKPPPGRSFTSEEVERAKATLVSGLAESLESVERVASDTAQLFSAELPDDYHARFATTVGAISCEAVQAEATSRLDPEGLVVVLVGDTARIEPSLSRLGLSVEKARPSLLE